MPTIARPIGPVARLRVEPLEERSPASSLLDLAYLGLTAAATGLPEPEATEPTGRVVFEVGGFEPVATTMLLDSGKMADVQPAAESHLSGSADRRGFDDELGTPAVGVAGASRWFWPAAVQPTVSAESPPMSGGFAVGTRGVADGAGTVRVAQDPGTLPNAAGAWDGNGGGSGSGDPSGGGSTGGGSSGGGSTGGGYDPSQNTVKYFSKAMVKTLDFHGNTVVEADPGQTPYPQDPEYNDANADGFIDPDSPDEWCVPVSYVRGTTPTMSGTFEVQWTSSTGGSPGSGRVWVQAYFGEFSMAPIAAEVSGNTVSFSNAPIDGTLRNEVWVGGGVVWAVGIEAKVGGIEWVQAGYTGNTIYITLAAPTVSPLYHTVVHVSTSASMGATTQQEVIDKTWAAFKTLDVYTARAAFGAEADRVTKKLHYYKEWNVPTFSDAPLNLLKEGDGRCGHWATFLRDTLKVHVNGVELYEVVPKKDTENFLIWKWTFTQPGTSGNPIYRYQNWLPEGNKIREKKNGSWDFVWDVVAEATYVASLGQGNTRPDALFVDHALVLIGGKLYDPSYGTGPFVDKTDEGLNGALVDWENQSVAGFALKEPAAVPGVPNVSAMLSRRDDIGVLESKKKGS